MLKTCYKALIIMLLLVFLFLLRNESAILEKISNYASILILILGSSVLLFWMHNQPKGSLNVEIRPVYHFWIIMLIWLFLIPLIFPNNGFSLQRFYEGMYHDYRYLLFATLPFIFISNSAKNYYNKLFIYVGYVALVVGCIGILIADKSLSSVSSRSTVYSLSYYFWWIVLTVFPYLFLVYYHNRKFKLGLYLIIIHLALSLLFLKRAGFLNATLIVLFVMIFSDKKNKALIAFLVVIVLVFFSTMFFGEYYDLLIYRFEKDSKNIDEWDRMSEIDEYFLNVPPMQIFTGFGANNYINMLYIGEYDKGVNSLHIGAYNLLYKGGLLYVAFVLFLAFKIISLYKYINQNLEIKIGFILGLVFIISFAYEQSWSYMPTIFFTLLPIYRAIYLKGLIKNGNAIRK